MATRRPTPAAAPAAATETAPSFTFTDAPVPETVRKSTAVNPLLDVCKQVAATMGDGDRSKVAKKVTAANEEQVKRIKRWLSEAGPECGVTFRSIVDGTSVTFWAVKRIVHKPRNNGNGSAAK